VPLDPGELTIDMRYRAQLAVPVRIAVLQSWTTTGTTSSDVALVRVEPSADPGLSPVFGMPPDSESLILQAAVFDAQTDALDFATGNVECRVTSSGERLLYSQDFAPEPGMSGGPLCIGTPAGVGVAGILTRRSSSGLVGLSLEASILAQLRSLLHP
jgi:hypothetical protein